MAGGGAVLLGGAAILAFTLGQTGDRPGADPRAAGALAAGLVAAMEAAGSEVAPYRCARLDEGPTPVMTRHIGARTWRVAGTTLMIEGDGERGGGKRLTIGVVADARGSSAELPRVREQFIARGVELVVSLGGMGRTRAEIEPALAALTAPDRWPMVALPGDREAVSDHRAAIAALAGSAVLDGSRVRVIAAGDIALATFPGAPHVSRLVAGDDGCMHTPDDARALSELLADAGRVRVLLSHVPPRQRGKGATDVSYSGIHIGEPFLADAIEQAGVRLTLHGMIAGARQPDRGKHAWRSGALVLGAGAADGVPDATRREPGGRPGLPVGLIAVVDRAGVSWQAVEKTGP